MIRTAALALALALGACGGESAQRAAQAWEMCSSGASASLALEACTNVLADEATPVDRRVVAYINRGAIRAGETDAARAVADFGRALRLDPDNTDALVRRGDVHYERGAHAAAIADYDAALRIDPSLQVAIDGRALAVGAGQLRFTVELEQLGEAIARDPGNPSLLNNRCWTRATAGIDLNLALADCTAALAIDPDSAATLDSRGLVHLKMANFEAALADYEAALAIEADSGHYLFGRGVARLRLGQEEAGRADLAAAEAARPGIGALYVTYGVTP